MALKVFLRLLVELIGLRAVISAHLAQVQCRRLQPGVWIASANQSRGVAQNLVFKLGGRIAELQPIAVEERTNRVVEGVE